MSTLRPFSFNNIEAQSEVVASVVGLHQTLDGIEILHGIDLEINPGLTVINGRSGSGKSTLFTCMSGLRQVTSGDIHFGAVNLAELDKDELTDWRGQELGIVYQNPLLINGQNVLNNIIGPEAMVRNSVDKERLINVAERLRIFDLLQRFPAELSGGEKQRVAIARAITKNPRIIFADEPTASLGTDDKDAVHKLFRESVDEDGATVVMISHEEIFNTANPPYADRIVTLKDGEVLDDRIV